jgi:tetratricopeptide (TPR) repeat protein
VGIGRRLASIGGVIFGEAARRRLPFRVAAAILAAVMLISSLVFFVGTGTTPAMLIDAIKGEGDGGPTIQEEIDKLRERVQNDPSDERAWTQLINAQFQAAATPENLDTQTGQATPSGKKAFGEVAATWDQYIQIVPTRIDPTTAGNAAQALALVERYTEAMDAQRIAMGKRPTAQQQLAFARFAYLAGRTEEADRAAAKAIRRTPRAQRKQMEQQVAVLKLMSQSGGQGATIGPDGQPQIPLEALGGMSGGGGANGGK